MIRIAIRMSARIVGRALMLVGGIVLIGGVVLPLVMHLQGCSQADVDNIAAASIVIALGTVIPGAFLAGDW